METFSISYLVIVWHFWGIILYVPDSFGGTHSNRCIFQPNHGNLSCSRFDSVSGLQESISNPSLWYVPRKHHNVATHSSNHLSSDVKDRISTVRILNVEDSQLWNFDLSLLQDLPNVTNVSFVENNISTFECLNITLPSVTRLVLTNNELKSISHQLLSVFPNLSSLILNESKLDDPPEFLINNTHMDIYLRANDWPCLDASWLFQMVSEKKVNLINRQHAKCMRGNAFPLLSLIEDCPINCTCRGEHMIFRVNCNGQNKTAFPLPVPAITGIINLENNRITDLSSLLKSRNVNGTHSSSVEDISTGVGTNVDNSKGTINPFPELKMLYLSNNSLTSIQELEHVENYLSMLVILHLDGNQLRHLPVRVLDRLFGNKLHELTLRGNPWDCACDNAVQIRQLLATHYKFIIDYQKVLCSSDDPLNPGKAIYYLTVSDLCSAHESVHYLDVLNGCMIIIILLCIGKLIYDYRYMKKTGQLPLGPYSLCAWFKIRKLRFRH